MSHTVKQGIISTAVIVLVLLLTSVATAEAVQPQFVSGRISFYSGGTTADGHQASEPGIAMREGPYDRSYCVTLHGGALHAILVHHDYGPASWTGRAIDITYAGRSEFQGKGSLSTDSYAKARLLPPKENKSWDCGVRK